ncbi:MAG: hypothetical protein WC544_02885 [Patescibacteria group bacterium]
MGNKNRELSQESMSLEINIPHLEQLFKKLAGIQSELAGYRRGHGVRDHTILVSEKCKRLGELMNMDKKDQFALFVAGLGHDIIQPEQTPKGSELEKKMEQSWDYQGSGEDANEERESSRFVEWYLNQPHLVEKMKENGIEFDEALKQRIINAIRNTAGSADLKTGKFTKPSGEQVEFSDLDEFEQTIYAADKMTGAEPSLIFDGIAKQTNLYRTTEHGQDASIEKFVADRFNHHLDKREKFFTVLQGAAEKGNLGILSKLPKEEFERIMGNISLQRELVGDLSESIETGTPGPVQEILQLADRLNKEKMEQGDVRGVDGFKVLQEWYSQNRENDEHPLVKKLLSSLKNQPELTEIIGWEK